MKIKEVFPNPTVKQVIFQIRYPNLFYIEKQIPDIQYKIMDVFPESALLFRRQLLFADVAPQQSLADIKGADVEADENKSMKIWQFISKKGYKLNILSNSLDITSEFHKTYNLEGGDKFRDIISLVLDVFFEQVPLKIINRIGLRYVDECPIIRKTNSSFRKYYNSVFPLDRFKLADAKEMFFASSVSKGKYDLNYSERLVRSDVGYKLILDFDGSATEVDINDCLNVTDALHSLISEEYEKTIKEPVIKYMRKKKV